MNNKRSALTWQTVDETAVFPFARYVAHSQRREYRLATPSTGGRWYLLVIDGGGKVDCVDTENLDGVKRYAELWETRLSRQAWERLWPQLDAGEGAGE